MEMYSPIRGPRRHDEYYLQGRCTVTVKPMEEIEAMLKERWPDKLQPVTSKLGSYKRIRQEGAVKDIHLPGSHTFEQ